MGPAIVITIGVLFLLQQMMRSGYFEFSNTYPVVLIVIGIVSLTSALASDEGHLSSNNPMQAPSQPPVSPGTTSSGFPGQGQ